MRGDNEAKRETMMASKMVNKVGGTNKQKKTYEVYQTSDGKTFVARLVNFAGWTVEGPWSAPFRTEGEAIKNAWVLWATPIAQRQQEEAEYKKFCGY